MTYQIDFQDVLFNCFEYLKIKPSADQSEVLYRNILEESLKFAQRELDPLYQSGDREGCHFENGAVQVPAGYREAYALFAQNGFLAMDIPEAMGGNNLPSCLMAVVYEIFTGANVSFLMYAGLTKGAADVIRSFGSETIVKLFCQKMYQGEWAGTMCLTEPQAGSDVGGLRTQAEPIENDIYSIKGNKIFISSGEHNLTENIIHLVLARVKGDPVGTKGISLFIVPKIWVDDAGSLAQPNHVACINIEKKMGIKAQATASLNFGESGLCRGILLGERCQGLELMFLLMNKARLLTGMQGMAIAATAYENARLYALEREQRGKKILLYPDVRRNLALCKSLVEGMRGLIYKTALLLDQANDGDANNSAANDEAELMVPVCKAYCSDQGFRVTELAMQVYGGYGYISEYPIEQYMRDAKISSIYEGTNGIQALDLLGRKLPQNNGQLFRSFYDATIKLATDCLATAELKESAESLRKATERLGQVVMQLAQWGMGGQKELALISATPFLEILGHVMLGRILLEQAQVALPQVALPKADQVFYQNKIKTAQFFINEFMPKVHAGAKSILAGSDAALTINF